MLLILLIAAEISIHALREEGDSALGRHCPQTHPISIHALREEGDAMGEVDPCKN